MNCGIVVGMSGVRGGSDPELVGGGGKAGGGDGTSGGMTSTCATPPKKSVMRAPLVDLLKRSVRTPGWEPIFVTSYESN